MQIESLQVFCDVARHRSFSRAGAANGVTQSAVSQIVSQLERRIGAQLVNRATRPLQLTTAGQAYYEGCKRLLEEYAELEAGIRTAEHEFPTTIQVAAIYSVGLSDMGQYVERFAQLYSAVRVNLEYLHPERVYEKVQDGTVDLGLVSFPRSQRKLVAIPWRDEPMVLVCSPQHPLAARRGIRPVDLNGQRYVGFDRNLVIRREVDRFLREHGATVDVVMEFDNIENIKKAIEIEAGVALLPEPTLRREVAAGSLAAVPLLGCRFVRPLGIIHRRQQTLSPSAVRFVELLRSPLAADRGRLKRKPASASRTSTRRETAAAPSLSLHTGANGVGASR
jgi:DNA-binding transcriptional LysR family regulator